MSLYTKKISLSSRQRSAYPLSTSVTRTLYLCNLVTTSFNSRCTACIPTISSGNYEWVRRENVLSAMQRALDIIVSLSSVKSLSYWRSLKECMDIRGILEERFLQEAYLCVNWKHPARFSGQDSSRQGPSQQTKGYRRPGLSIPTPNLSTCRSHTCWDLSRIHLATPSLARRNTKLPSTVPKGL